MTERVDPMADSARQAGEERAGAAEAVEAVLKRNENWTASTTILIAEVRAALLTSRSDQPADDAELLARLAAAEVLADKWESSQLLIERALGYELRDTLRAAPTATVADTRTDPPDLHDHPHTPDLCRRVTTACHPCLARFDDWLLAQDAALAATTGSAGGERGE